MDHRDGGADGRFEVLGQPAVASEPGECPLDHPAALGGSIPEGTGADRPRRAPWQEGKAACARVAHDDLEPYALLGHRTGGGLTLVAAISEDQPQPGKTSP